MKEKVIEKTPTKITWMKKEFNIHDQEKILLLAEKFKANGFVVYDFLFCFLAKNNEFKILRNSMKFKLFLNNVCFQYSIHVEEINEIIDFIIEQGLVSFEEGFIILEDLETTFCKVEEITKKRIEAGKISAEKRKRLAEEKSKDSDKSMWKDNAFNSDKTSFKKQKPIDDIDELEGDFSNVAEEFKGDFDIEGKQEKPPLVIKEYDSPEGRELLEKDVLDFYEITTELFNKNTEPQSVRNKMEKEAVNRLTKMIKQGIFRYVNLPDHDPNLELKKSIGKILNSKVNPSFYLTALYNQEMGDLLEIKNQDPKDFEERIYKDIYAEMDLSFIE